MGAKKWFKIIVKLKKSKKDKSKEEKVISFVPLFRPCISILKFASIMIIWRVFLYSLDILSGLVLLRWI